MNSSQRRPRPIPRRRFIGLAGSGVLLVAGGGVASAAVDGGGVAAVTSEGRDGTARLRFVHGALDTPDVDVYVRGGPSVEHLAFRDVSPYAAVSPGTYAVEMYATGSDPLVSRPVHATTVSLPVDTDYSLAVVGRPPRLAVEVLVDENVPVGPGQVRLRAVHLSPDAPSVDVAVADGGPVLFDSLSYLDASPYRTLDSGAYAVDLQTGDPPTALDVVSDSLSLTETATYTVFVSGSVDVVGIARAIGLTVVVDDRSTSTADTTPDEVTDDTGETPTDSDVSTDDTTETDDGDQTDTDEHGDDTTAGDDADGTQSEAPEPTAPATTDGQRSEPTADDRRTDRTRRETAGSKRGREQERTKTDDAKTQKRAEKGKRKARKRAEKEKRKARKRAEKEKRKARKRAEKEKRKARKRAEKG